MIDRREPLSASVDVSGVSSTASAPALTPEALLAFCTSRLQNLDGHIERLMNQQEGRSTLEGRITSLQSRFAEKSMQGGIGKETDVKHTSPDPALDREMDALIADLGAGPAQSKLIRMREDYRHSGYDDDGYISAEECRTMAETIGMAAADLSKSSEIEMIQLQSLVSQRQLAVQLTTNLMQSLNDTFKAIAQKIGS